MKCNVDAAMNNSRRSLGIGCTTLKPLQFALFGYNIFMLSNWSEALSWIKAIGVQKIQIEMDTMTGVNAISFKYFNCIILLVKCVYIYMYIISG